MTGFGQIGEDVALLLSQLVRDVSLFNQGRGPTQRAFHRHQPTQRRDQELPVALRYRTGSGHNYKATGTGSVSWMRRQAPLRKRRNKTSDSATM